MAVETGTNGTKCDHGGRRRLIVESLLADVFLGRVEAGRHLVTQQLAERFGMSHTPVREALVALSAMGVVNLLPNRGAIVRHVQAKDVREMIRVRRALECEAVRGACGRIEEAELHYLAAELARLATAKNSSYGRDFQQARTIDNRLHDLIARSCGNAFLENELDRLKMLFRAVRDVSYTRHVERNDLRRLAEEAREHLQIIQALLAGDRRQAVCAMSRHLKSGVKYWCRSLPAGPGSPAGSAAADAHRAKPVRSPRRARGRNSGAAKTVSRRGSRVSASR